MPLTLPLQQQQQHSLQHSLHLGSIASLRTVVAVAVLAALVAAAIRIVLAAHDRLVQRAAGTDDVPDAWIQQQRVLYGRVLRISDGDGFRMMHLPVLERWLLFGTPRTGSFRESLFIRLAAVDAPESAAFGNPAQPFAAEAKAWLANCIDGRIVRVKLLRRDQYGRLVGMVYVSQTFCLLSRTINVPMELLRKGLAVVYRSQGAEYGGLRGEFERVEAEARRKRRGLWALDRRDFESPGAYKRRTKGDVIA
ncbi:hypothetical protein BC831DRAFT_455932 [Entophlyctis helioformis]|nr:hypothetical protein BC831DRAFT_425606 [Entophlyctis helioformis]KAI8926605.1 hypothetical protein BC831DRAFT_455932 [Entophlyctis helioformis]